MGTQTQAAWSALRVPHSRSSVVDARHALARRLTHEGVARPDCDDAVLILSELVSNAVKYARPLSNGEILVRWTVGPDSLHLEIIDGGSTTLPRAKVAPSDALGGRGLDIVRTLSTRWGVTEDAGRVTVWADLPRHSRGVRTGTPRVHV